MPPPSTDKRLKGAFEALFDAFHQRVSQLHSRYGVPGLTPPTAFPIAQSPYFVTLGDYAAGHTVSGGSTLPSGALFSPWVAGVSSRSLAMPGSAPATDADLSFAAAQRDDAVVAQLLTVLYPTKPLSEIETPPNGPPLQSSCAATRPVRYLDGPTAQRLLRLLADETSFESCRFLPLSYFVHGLLPPIAPSPKATTSAIPSSPPAPPASRHALVQKAKTTIGRLPQKPATEAKGSRSRPPLVPSDEPTNTSSVAPLAAGGFPRPALCAIHKSRLLRLTAIIQSGGGSAATAIWGKEDEDREPISWVAMGSPSRRVVAPAAVSVEKRCSAVESSTAYDVEWVPCVIHGFHGDNERMFDVTLVSDPLLSAGGGHTAPVGSLAVTGTTTTSSTPSMVGSLSRPDSQGGPAAFLTQLQDQNAVPTPNLSAPLSSKTPSVNGGGLLGVPPVALVVTRMRLRLPAETAASHAEALRLADTVRLEAERNLRRSLMVSLLPAWNSSVLPDAIARIVSRATIGVHPRHAGRVAQLIREVEDVFAATAKEASLRYASRHPAARAVLSRLDLGVLDDDRRRDDPEGGGDTTCGDAGRRPRRVIFARRSETQHPSEHSTPMGKRRGGGDAHKATPSQQAILHSADVLSKSFRWSQPTMSCLSDLIKLWSMKYANVLFFDLRYPISATVSLSDFLATNAAALKAAKVELQLHLTTDVDSVVTDRITDERFSFTFLSASAYLQSDLKRFFDLIRQLLGSCVKELVLRSLGLLAGFFDLESFVENSGTLVDRGAVPRTTALATTPQSSRVVRGAVAPPLRGATPPESRMPLATRPAPRSGQQAASTTPHPALRLASYDSSSDRYYSLAGYIPHRRPKLAIDLALLPLSAGHGSTASTSTGSAGASNVQPVTPTPQFSILCEPPEETISSFLGDQVHLAIEIASSVPSIDGIMLAPLRLAPNPLPSLEREAPAVLETVRAIQAAVGCIVPLVRSAIVLYERFVISHELVAEDYFPSVLPTRIAAAGPPNGKSAVSQEPSAASPTAADASVAAVAAQRSGHQTPHATTQQQAVQFTAALTEEYGVISRMLTQLSWASPDVLDCGPFVIQVARCKEGLADAWLRRRRQLSSMVEDRIVRVSDRAIRDMEAMHATLVAKPTTAEEMHTLLAYSVEARGTLQTIRQRECFVVLSWIRLLESQKVPVGSDAGAKALELFNLPPRLDDAFVLCDDTLRNERARMMSELTHFTESIHAKISTAEQAVEELFFASELERLDTTVAMLSELRGTIVGIEQAVQTLQRRQSIFGLEATHFPKFIVVTRHFEVLDQFWTAIRRTTDGLQSFLESPFSNFDFNTVADDVDEWRRNLRASTRCLRGFHETFNLGRKIEAQIAKFQDVLPMVELLKAPGMRAYHWRDLGKRMGVAAGQELLPSDTSVTLQRLLDADFTKHVPVIEEISDMATKEHDIEVRLEQMKLDARTMKVCFADTGGGRSGTGAVGGRGAAIAAAQAGRIVANLSDMQLMTEHCLVVTRQMRASQHVTMLQSVVADWETLIERAQSTLHLFSEVQHHWLELLPVLASDMSHASSHKDPTTSTQANQESMSLTTPGDAASSSRSGAVVAPTDACVSYFSFVDDLFRSLMDDLEKSPMTLSNVLFMESLPARLSDISDALKKVRSEVLQLVHSKRSLFARFYFLTDFELLSCLTSSNLDRLVPLLRRMYFRIADMTVHPTEGSISAFITSDGVKLKLEAPIPRPSAVEPIEVFMNKVERTIRSNMVSSLQLCLTEYSTTSFRSWLFRFAYQFADVVLRTRFGQELHEVVDTASTTGLRAFLKKTEYVLQELYSMLRSRSTMRPSDLSSLTNATLRTLIDRDEIERLVLDGLSTKEELDTVPSMRTIVESDGRCVVRLLGVDVRYGYELLGAFHLPVMTSSMLMKVHHSMFLAAAVGAQSVLVGRAGSGKTESVRSLANTCGKFLYLVPCAGSLSAITLQAVVEGCVRTGAWLCMEDIDALTPSVAFALARTCRAVAAARRSRVNQGAQQLTQHITTTLTKYSAGDVALFATTRLRPAAAMALDASVTSVFRPVNLPPPPIGHIAQILFSCHGFEASAASFGLRLAGLYNDFGESRVTSALPPLAGSPKTATMMMGNDSSFSLARLVQVVKWSTSCALRNHHEAALQAALRLFVRPLLPVRVQTAFDLAAHPGTYDVALPSVHDQTDPLPDDDTTVRSRGASLVDDEAAIGVEHTTRLDPQLGTVVTDDDATPKPLGVDNTAPKTGAADGSLAAKRRVSLALGGADPWNGAAVRDEVAAMPMLLQLQEMFSVTGPTSGGAASSPATTATANATAVLCNAYHAASGAGSPHAALLLVGPPFSGKSTCVAALTAIEPSNVSYVAPRTLPAAMLYGYFDAIGGWKSGVFDAVGARLATSNDHVLVLEHAGAAEDEGIIVPLSVVERRTLQTGGPLTYVTDTGKIIVKAVSIAHASPRLVGRCTVVSTADPVSWAAVFYNEMLRPKMITGQLVALFFDLTLATVTCVQGGAMTAAVAPPTTTPPAARASLLSPSAMRVAAFRAARLWSHDLTRLFGSSSSSNGSNPVASSDGSPTRGTTIGAPPSQNVALIVAEALERHLNVAVQSLIFSLAWSFAASSSDEEQAAVEAGLHSPAAMDTLGAMVRDIDSGCEWLPLKGQLFHSVVSMQGWRRMPSVDPEMFPHLFFSGAGAATGGNNNASSSAGGGAAGGATSMTLLSSVDGASGAASKPPGDAAGAMRSSEQYFVRGAHPLLPTKTVIAALSRVAYFSHVSSVMLTGGACSGRTSVLKAFAQAGGIGDTENTYCVSEQVSRGGSSLWRLQDTLDRNISRRGSANVFGPSTGKTLIFVIDDAHLDAVTPATATDVVAASSSNSRTATPTFDPAASATTVLPVLEWALFLEARRRVTSGVHGCGVLRQVKSVVCVAEGAGVAVSREQTHYPERLQRFFFPVSLTALGAATSGNPIDWDSQWHPAMCQLSEHYLADSPGCESVGRETLKFVATVVSRLLPYTAAAAASLAPWSSMCLHQYFHAVEAALVAIRRAPPPQAARFATAEVFRVLAASTPVIDPVLVRSLDTSAVQTFASLGTEAAAVVVRSSGQGSSGGGGAVDSYCTASVVRDVEDPWGIGGGLPTSSDRQLSSSVARPASAVQSPITTTGANGGASSASAPSFDRVTAKRATKRIADAIRAHNEHIWGVNAAASSGAVTAPSGSQQGGSAAATAAVANLWRTHRINAPSTLVGLAARLLGHARDFENHLLVAGSPTAEVHKLLDIVSLVEGVTVFVLKKAAYRHWCAVGKLAYQMALRRDRRVMIVLPSYVVASALAAVDSRVSGRTATSFHVVQRSSHAILTHQQQDHPTTTADESGSSHPSATQPPSATSAPQPGRTVVVTGKVHHSVEESAAEGLGSVSNKKKRHAAIARSTALSASAQEDPSIYDVDGSNLLDDIDRAILSDAASLPSAWREDDTAMRDTIFFEETGSSPEAARQSTVASAAAATPASLDLTARIRRNLRFVLCVDAVVSQASTTHTLASTSASSSAALRHQKSSGDVIGASNSSSVPSTPSSVTAPKAPPPHSGDQALAELTRSFASVRQRFTFVSMGNIEEGESLRELGVSLLRSMPTLSDEADALGSIAFVLFETVRKISGQSFGRSAEATSVFSAFVSLFARLVLLRRPELKNLADQSAALSRTHITLMDTMGKLTARQRELNPQVSAVNEMILEDDRQLTLLVKEMDDLKTEFRTLEASTVVVVSSIEGKKHNVSQLREAMTVHLTDSRNGLLEIDAKQISNLRLSISPPAKVKTLIEGVLCVLGEKPEKNARASLAPDHWTLARRLMEDPDFIGRLCAVHPDQPGLPTPEQLQPFVELCEANRFSQFSAFVQAMADWVVALHSAVLTTKKVSDLLNEIQAAQSDMMGMVENLEAKREKLNATAKKLTLLRSSLDKQRTLRDKSQEELLTTEKRLKNIGHVLQMVSTMTANFEKSYHAAQNQDTSLIGDVFLAAAHIVLVSQLPPDTTQQPSSAGAAQGGGGGAGKSSLSIDVAAECDVAMRRVLSQHELPASPGGQTDLRHAVDPRGRVLPHELRGIAFPPRLSAILAAVSLDVLPKMPCFVTQHPLVVSALEEQLRRTRFDLVTVTPDDANLHEQILASMKAGGTVMVCNFALPAPPQWDAFLDILESTDTTATTSSAAPNLGDAGSGHPGPTAAAALATSLSSPPAAGNGSSSAEAAMTIAGFVRGTAGLGDPTAQQHRRLKYGNQIVSVHPRFMLCLACDTVTDELLAFARRHFMILSLDNEPSLIRELVAQSMLALRVPQQEDTDIRKIVHQFQQAQFRRHQSGDHIASLVRTYGDQIIDSANLVQNFDEHVSSLTQAMMAEADLSQKLRFVDQRRREPIALATEAIEATLRAMHALPPWLLPFPNGDLISELVTRTLTLNRTMQLDAAAELLRQRDTHEAQRMLAASFALGAIELLLLGAPPAGRLLVACIILCGLRSHGLFGPQRGHLLGEELLASDLLAVVEHVRTSMRPALLSGQASPTMTSKDSSHQTPPSSAAATTTEDGPRDDLDAEIDAINALLDQGEHDHIIVQHLHEALSNRDAKTFAWALSLLYRHLSQGVMGGASSWMRGGSILAAAQSDSDATKKCVSLSTPQASAARLSHHEFAAAGGSGAASPLHQTEGPKLLEGRTDAASVIHFAETRGWPLIVHCLDVQEVGAEVQRAIRRAYAMQYYVVVEPPLDATFTTSSSSNVVTAESGGPSHADDAADDTTTTAAAASSSPSPAASTEKASSSPLTLPSKVLEFSDAPPVPEKCKGLWHIVAAKDPKADLSTMQAALRAMAAQRRSGVFHGERDVAYQLVLVIPRTTDDVIATLAQGAMFLRFEPFTVREHLSLCIVQGPAYLRDWREALNTPIGRAALGTVLLFASVAGRARAAASSLTSTAGGGNGGLFDLGFTEMTSVDESDLSLLLAIFRESLTKGLSSTQYTSRWRDPMLCSRYIVDAILASRAVTPADETLLSGMVAHFLSDELGAAVGGAVHTTTTSSPGLMSPAGSSRAISNPIVSSFGGVIPVKSDLQELSQQVTQAHATTTLNGLTLLGHEQEAWSAIAFAQRLLHHVGKAASSLPSGVVMAQIPPPAPPMNRPPAPPVARSSSAMPPPRRGSLVKPPPSVGTLLKVDNPARQKSAVRWSSAVWHELRAAAPATSHDTNGEAWSFPGCGETRLLAGALQLLPLRSPNECLSLASLSQLRLGSLAFPDRFLAAWMASQRAVLQVPGDATIDGLRVVVVSRPPSGRNATAVPGWQPCLSHADICTYVTDIPVKPEFVVPLVNPSDMVGPPPTVATSRPPRVSTYCRLLNTFIRPLRDFATLALDPFPDDIVAEVGGGAASHPSPQYACFLAFQPFNAMSVAMGRMGRGQLRDDAIGVLSTHLTTPGDVAGGALSILLPTVGIEVPSTVVVVKRTGESTQSPQGAQPPTTIVPLLTRVMLRHIVDSAGDAAQNQKAYAMRQPYYLGMTDDFDDSDDSATARRLDVAHHDLCQRVGTSFVIASF